jgi:hypothetical protein
MGHASMRASLFYQHATSERGREIAQAMDVCIAKQFDKAQKTGKPVSLAKTNKKN